VAQRAIHAKAWTLGSALDASAYALMHALTV